MGVSSVHRRNGLRIMHAIARIEKKENIVTLQEPISMCSPYLWL